MQQLISLNLYHFLMVFLRLGSALMVMPGFTTSYVSTQVRLSAALALSVVMVPVVAPHLPAPPQTLAVFFRCIAFEVTVGIFLGVVMQIMYSALNLAGNFAGQAIGFSNAQIFDPAFQAQSIVLETFLSLTALTVIFLMDLHHLMLGAIVDSYHIFPVGGEMPWGDFANELSSDLNQAFITGFKIGAPFIAFTIVFYAGMGLVSRLMPQLNIFFLSLPLQIYLGLGLLFITLPIMIMWFIRYFENGLNRFLH